jgi:1-deoxy-D-xylulose-5-phosphate reductoisomerase
MQADRNFASGEGPKSITILGSTGSVGCNTIDLIERNPDAFKVCALTANKAVDLLNKQARALNAEFAVVADETHYADLKEALSGSGIEVAAGKEALVEAAKREADFVMAAIVGAAGLPPTLAAIERGTVIGLANKETLVCAGDLMIEVAKNSGAKLLPVDSEHNAIFQVFSESQRDQISRIILTASGGPFRRTPLEDMRNITPAQAIAHPNWDMGVKISVDSATLMNKGLELIEAHYLFAMPEERIEILVHPQSVIHSMVGYRDGSVLAQLGQPDMRTPISYAIAWPNRMQTPTEELDFAKIASLDFEAPDDVRFPALRLARESLRQGGSAPVIMNAANEIAVEAFLAEQIGFLDIIGLVESVLESYAHSDVNDLESVVEHDFEARRYSRERLIVAAE